MNSPNSNYVGLNAGKNRRKNVGVVLRAIHSNESPSRSNLAQITGLAKPTISNIVQELMDLGIVIESGEGESSEKGGRRPIGLQLRKDAVLSIGVDIRRNQVSVVSLNLEGQIISRETSDVDIKENREEILSVLCSTISSVIDSTKKQSITVGIGVGVPGPLDPEKGIVLNPPYFRALENVNLKKYLALRYKLPVFVQLAALAGAVGEYFHKGIAYGTERSLAYLEIDIGIGVGMVIGGRKIHGVSSGGAFGHTVVKENGIECHCGRRGCLIQYASGLAMLKKLGLVDTEVGIINVLNDRSNYSTLLRRVIDGYRSGDNRYIGAVEEASKYLSIGIVNFFNMLSPHYFVLGSSIPDFADILWKPIVDRIEKITTIETGIKERLCRATYGNESIAAGAATLILNSFLEDPRGML